MQKRVNCWAHVHRNIETHMRSISKIQAMRMMDDIKKIQILFDTQLFISVTDLFTDKWSKVNGKAIETFLVYFSNQWCKEGNNVGNAPGLPSTTNALESIHEKIKMQSRETRGVDTGAKGIESDEEDERENNESKRPRLETIQPSIELNDKLCGH
ncbi:unnamed protein product [Brachionus calyciflorus]|uniref:MULE transposase domain-containing protein n=1 Tax=Brachionus calyciflorus TaxID=104777 RepID=A0A814L4R7_9BILA|nr:unnamed protein product [Brachionus calyciflorus]